MVSTHLQVLKYLVEEDPDDSVNVVHMQVGGRGGKRDMPAMILERKGGGVRVTE